MGDDEDIHALICMDDPDDQFIFASGLSELDPRVRVTFFLEARELLTYLLDKAKNEAAKSSRLMILADLRVPFFTMDHVQFIRSLKYYDGSPLFIFAENYVKVDQGDIVARGATAFFHKPGNVHSLKEVLRQILQKSRATA